MTLWRLCLDRGFRAREVWSEIIIGTIRQQEVCCVTATFAGRRGCAGRASVAFPRMGASADWRRVQGESTRELDFCERRLVMQQRRRLQMGVSGLQAGRARDWIARARR
jgi:hypothetical protein